MYTIRAIAVALLASAAVSGAPQAKPRVHCYNASTAATIDMNSVYSTIDAFCERAADMTFGPHTVDSYSQRAFFVKNQVVLEIKNTATCSFSTEEAACKAQLRRPLHACVSQGSVSVVCGSPDDEAHEGVL
ncbi:hypothetical protein HDZ31DRAFT_50755 [Schizophyllum fasciatum]